MDVEKKDEQPLRSSTPAIVPVSASDDDASRKRKRQRRIICWSSVIGITLTNFLVILILSLTVYKAKKPVITVDSIRLDDLDFSVNPFPVRVSLNLSLTLRVMIKNPNRVSVKYRSTFATLWYRGIDIGNAPIPAGTIGSHDTTRMNLTLTLFADRVAKDADIYRDILKGNLPTSTFTRIKGKVHVLFIKIHVKATSTCDVNIDIRSSTIANQTCHSKVKI